jgi:hypothetical protein
MKARHHAQISIFLSKEQFSLNGQLVRFVQASLYETESFDISYQVEKQAGTHRQRTVVTVICC